VRNEGGNNLVFTVSENKAVKNEVTIGQTLGSYVEVISGLKSGQIVINNLDDKIKDGTQIKLAE
jgi:cysteine sulfinate desulfinase/cysteine desulfurase-like protein